MKKYVFGADLGGTTVKLGFFRTDGELLNQWEIPTVKEEGGRQIIPDIGKSLLAFMQRENIPKDEVEGIGLDVPGAVSREGLVLTGVNIGWEGEKDAASELSAITDLPVVCANDANAAALGEQWMGSGKNTENLIMVTLGTGVGAGVIIGGRILAGAHGSAGEVGHTALFPELQEKCGCGNTGCFEQLCSAGGMMRTAAKYAPSGSIDGVPLEKLNPKEIFTAAGKGNTLCAEIVAEYAANLGRGLAVFASILDPEVILIGGGISHAGEALLIPVREAYRKHVFYPAADTPIIRASLGNNAGIYGCARLVLTQR